MAQDYAERAKWLLREAENAFSAGNNAICVRRSQEALELAAKAALRRVSIEYPREHDVSEAVDAAAERFPDYIRARIVEIKSMLVELARVRGAAIYGYEIEGIPASEAFTKEYAAETFGKTRELAELCVRFASE